ncbi:phage tail protein, partial [Bifidobacterium longum subsp. longum]|nr:phage tail protein [Bifidobacterium longum subsp. longum]
MGSVAGQQGGRWVYNGSGGYSASEWYSSWDSQIKPGTFQYGSIVYKTSYPFDDDPSTSVDKIAYDNIARADATPNLIIIVLDKYQPKPPETPPAPPTKKVEQGTSADGMSNETVISTGTGVGGKRMVVQDAIDPNGMAYK